MQTMSKVEQQGEDQDLALLAYRITPRVPERFGPAEAMTQHKFRALLSLKQHLSAKLTTGREIMLQHRQQQAEHYDQTACQLQELQQ